MVRKRRGVVARVVEEVQKRAGSDKVAIGSSDRLVVRSDRRPGCKKYTPANHFTFYLALSRTLSKFEHAVNPLMLGSINPPRLLSLSGSPGRRLILVRLQTDGMVYLKDATTNESVYVPITTHGLRVANPWVFGEVTCHGCHLTWNSDVDGGFYHHHPSPICGDCFVKQAKKRRVFVEPTVLDLSTEQLSQFRQAFVSLKHKPAGDMEAGFIHDLYANPSDKERWLVYSDWLEDREPFSTALQAAQLIREAVAPGEFSC